MLPRPESIADTILVTHKGCMDGSGCAIVFQAAGGKKENIRYVAAGMVERFIKDEPLIDSDRFMLFADVGFPDDQKYVNKLEKRGNVVVLDHHKTSAHMKDRSWCKIDVDGNGGSACGCEMLRQYLGLEDQSTRYLCEVIDDHDRWLRKTPLSEELATLSVFLGQKIFIEWFTGRDFSNGLFTKTELDMLQVLKERRDENIETAIKKALVKDVVFNGVPMKIGYVVTPEPNISLLLDTLLERRPELDVACSIGVDKGAASFRTKKSIDVSEIAKYFGGGGHRAAAGHRLPDSMVKELIEVVHDW